MQLLSIRFPSQANLTSSPIDAEVDQKNRCISPVALVIRHGKLAEISADRLCIAQRLDLNLLYSPLSLPAGALHTVNDNSLEMRDRKTVMAGQ